MSQLTHTPAVLKCFEIFVQTLQQVLSNNALEEQQQRGFCRGKNGVWTIKWFHPVSISGYIFGCEILDHLHSRMFSCNIFNTKYKDGNLSDNHPRQMRVFEHFWIYRSNDKLRDVPVHQYTFCPEIRAVEMYGTSIDLHGIRFALSNEPFTLNLRVDNHISYPVLVIPKRIWLPE